MSMEILEVKALEFNITMHGNCDRKGNGRVKRDLFIWKRKKWKPESEWVRSIGEEESCPVLGDRVCVQCKPCSAPPLIICSGLPACPCPTWKSLSAQDCPVARSHSTAYHHFGREIGHRTCSRLWKGWPGRCWSGGWLETNKDACERSGVSHHPSHTPTLTPTSPFPDLWEQRHGLKIQASLEFCRDSTLIVKAPAVVDLPSLWFLSREER